MAVRRVLVLLGGTVVFLVLAVLMHGVRADEAIWPRPELWSWIGVFAVQSTTIAYVSGIFSVRYSVVPGLLAATGSVATGALILGVEQLVVARVLLPRFVLLTGTVGVAAWYFVYNRGISHLKDNAIGRDRVFVICSPAEAAMLDLEVGYTSERPSQLVGGLDPDQPGLTAATVRERAKSSGASVLVLDRAAQSAPQVVDSVAGLHAEGIRVRSLGQFYADWLGKVPHNELERTSLLFDIGELHRRLYARIKRLMDVVIALLGMGVLVLAIPLVAAGNLLGNRGPLFFLQPRVGRSGRVFTMVKFRTMRPTSVGTLDSSWTSESDPRVTPFGRILRRSHLDELPQMVNILRGELSAVGPRPEQPHYVDELRKKISFYDVRHLVRPGVTGWAQVKFRYASDEADALEKLQYDLYYLEHQSLSLDCRVIARTLQQMFRLAGR